MLKNNRIKVWIMISLALILTGCGSAEEKTPVSVYMTDQYMAYRNCYLLIAESSKKNLLERIEGSSETMKENGEDIIQEYYLFERDDFTVQLNSIWSSSGYQGDYYQSIFTIYQDSEEVCSFERSYSDGNRDDFFLAYADVTEDNNKDLILYSHTYGGTLNSYSWAVIYDIKNNRMIDLFGDGIHAELSDEQLDQIEKMQNEKYGEVFIGRDNMYYVGERVYVDEYGNIYFECTHWKDNAFPEALGEAVLFFSYHSDTEEFNTVDMMYCPLYVYE